MGFSRRNVQPGQFVESVLSERPLRLDVQVFDKGERLISIAVVDPDVPDLKNDSFSSRCHYLAVNIPISPSRPVVALGNLKDDEHVIHSWLPTFAQKGSPYHRIAVFVLQQNAEEPLDLETMKRRYATRHGWKLKPLLSQYTSLTPIGVNIFRTKWDEETDDLMKRLDVRGVGTELVRKKPEKNVYKKKDGSRYR